MDVDDAEDGLVLVSDAAASTEEECVELGPLLRSWGSVARVLEELRDCDDASALGRAASLSRSALFEIGAAVPADLLDELGRLVGTGWTEMPTRDELRVFDALLVGWVDGATSSAQVKVELPALSAGVPEVDDGYL